MRLLGPSFLVLACFVVAPEEAATRRIPRGSPPQVADNVVPCDNDRDGDCDGRDLWLVTRVIGECIWGGHYNEPADADHDGCVTVSDVKRLVVDGWDFDKDDDVDRDDLDMLLRDQGKSVKESRCGSHCDLNQDGTITPEDARMLEPYCSRPGCVTESASSD